MPALVSYPRLDTAAIGFACCSSIDGRKRLKTNAVIRSIDTDQRVWGFRVLGSAWAANIVRSDERRDP
jgi:hypothetical protein